jgi:DNA-binding response OmpR family regulator
MKQTAWREFARVGPPGAAPLESEETAAMNTRPTVLIVEDEPHQRLLYEDELRRHGFDTLTAADGARCLENLLAMDIDLIILDIRLPGMDGIDLLSRIRGHDRTVPVIINTAYSGYQENYLTWPADAFVVKSSDLTQLVDKAVRLTRQKRDAAAE